MNICFSYADGKVLRGNTFSEDELPIDCFEYLSSLEGKANKIFIASPHPRRSRLKGESERRPFFKNFTFEIVFIDVDEDYLGSAFIYGCSKDKFADVFSLDYTKVRDNSGMIRNTDGYSD
jgi:hypothetical protein